MNANITDLFSKAKNQFGAWSAVKSVDKWAQLDKITRQYWAYLIYNHEYRNLVITSIRYR